MRFLAVFGLAGSIMFLGFAATPQAAEPLSHTAPPGGIAVAAPPPDAAPPRAPRSGGASQIPANGGRITLEVNKGTLVRLSGSAATVFVANPEIADVQVKSPTLVYISAKAPGETVIYAVDASDSVLLNVSILVEHDISRLRSSLRQLAPGEGISADSVDGNLVLSGGVSLTFTPTVIDANHLNLRVRPEVSELSTTGEVSVPIAPGQVVTIPALTVRRAEASVELGSGESFALAGLLQHTSTQTISKVPWLGDIPILGALFKSDGFQRGETDLVVIVTPYLVNPVKTRLAAPTDGLKLPTMRSGCCSATSTARACPDPGRARSMPAAMA